MKMNRLTALSIIGLVALLGTVLPACSRPVRAASSYLAVVPKVMQSGSTQALSLALFSGNRPASGDVQVSLLQNGKTVAEAKKSVNGNGTVNLAIPDIADGEYTIRVKGPGFDDKAQVRIDNSFLIFIETDKPIYKPGQTIQIRVLTLNAELRPVSEDVTFEVMDAKGIKVFRTETQTDDFGMASLELPLSTEPNTGVWKLTAAAGKGKAQLDVRVEKYVLPKYEVKPELAKEWFLVNEAITGKVAAEYSFGKPVKGELEIKASRYVGTWQEFATFNKQIDGSADFSLPAAGYVAGTPASGGMGNVLLDITVREKSTGYEEKTSRLLTVAAAPLNIKLIPEGTAYKPGLPFNILVVSSTPDGKMVDATVKLNISYLDGEFKEAGKLEKSIKTVKGKAVLELTPPQDSAAMMLSASANDAYANKIVQASYSPSGSFIQIEQLTLGALAIGQEVRFKVYSTKPAGNLYYEVISRGRVVFSDFTGGSEIAFQATPLMAPESRLLVYQIQPNSEVAADYLPFQVTAEYPNAVKAQFAKDEVKPGDKVGINISAAANTKVGIAAVDKSVFILAENRLNLQQVFDELERLYMAPQAELHEVTIYPVMTTVGAQETFENAGVVVLSNNKVPEGKEYKADGRGWGRWLPPMPMFGAWEEAGDVRVAAPTTSKDSNQSDTTTLAEVQRVRQFFPETWLWQEVVTGANGQATLNVDVPDTITTWMLRAVAISKDKGLGIAEDELRVFQPFFVTVDLPYSAIRGEEFPVKVAIYNYLNEEQRVIVQLAGADWFELLDQSEKTVEIAPNDIGGVEFKIKPGKLGINQLKVTAASPKAADAVVKTLIVEPEGVARETVSNLTLSESKPVNSETATPPGIIDGSGRAYIALTSSFLAQTMEGLEALIQMPFGCGEQNMILFAPDVYITRYLRESGQLKAEIMAKAEKLMITGYQRELTYRRGDGSFSAFGQSDQEGSLWLTAFVLKSFAQARDLIYIDEDVLARAQAWITAHQNADGSFDPVGFVAHQEMMGGVSGKDSLTAYVAIALLEAGEQTAAGKAVAYLEGRLGKIDDPYTMAIAGYALELAGSPRKDDAQDQLMKMAQEDENGLYWASTKDPLPLPAMEKAALMPRMPIEVKTTGIEATGYATLALLKHGDAINASKAARWLVSKRNAYGGYGSTQDTVVALQALIEQAAGARADVDLTVNIKAGEVNKQLRITRQNSDVLQVIEVPTNQTVELTAKGKGEVIAQVVTRFNLPQAATVLQQILTVDVGYDAGEVQVNDLVTVSAKVRFNPPVPMEAGMTVVDISVPTGFAPVTESLDQAIKSDARMKRYDIAGRKVIFYIENLRPGEQVAFSFKVKALYPVKAKGVASQAYSYYQPEIRGETLGKDITIK